MTTKMTQERGCAWLKSLAIIIPVIAFMVVFVSAANADILAPTGAYISATSTTALTVTWSSGGATDLSNDFVVQKSTDGVTFTNASTSIATSTLSYTVTGLSVNTQYTLRVAATGGGVSTTSYSTTSAAYTLANAAAKPTTGTVTVSTIPITINVNSNPANTTYAIYNTFDDIYVDADGVFTATPTYRATSTWGSSFAVTQLPPGTDYAFEVVAKNGDGVLAASSTVSDTVYTLASAAIGPTVGTPTNTTIPLTIATNSNGPDTTYALYNNTLGNYLNHTTGAAGAADYQSSATWGSSFAATGLSGNTAYQFLEIAKNGDGAYATSSATTAVYTLATTPSSLSSTVSATNYITIDWDGDATSYYVKSSVDSYNSGWLTNKTWSAYAPGCGTTYTYQVKGKNAVGTETSYSSSVSATSNACGGGSAAGGGSGATPNSADVLKPSVITQTPTPTQTPTTVSQQFQIPAGYERVSDVASMVNYSVMIKDPNSKAIYGIPKQLSTVGAYTFTKFLNIGSSGQEVRELQQRLRDLGYFTYPQITGYFGKVTQEAVIKLQKAYNLIPPAGYVGPGTRKVLNGQ